MDMVALVRFNVPRNVDIVNSDFLEELAEYVSNEMSSDFSFDPAEDCVPGVSYAAGKINVEWYFDSHIDGFNTEMLRIFKAVSEFLVDAGHLSSSIIFTVTCDEVEK